MITEKARCTIIDCQAPIQFWEKAVNTAVCLDQRSPTKGLMKLDYHDGYKAPYETPYDMLYTICKPPHDDAGNKMSYKAPVHLLRRLGCYESELIHEAQHQSKFSPRSKPWRLVGYTHNSTTFWRIWNPHFAVVQVQSEVVIDEEGTACISCATDGIDIFTLPEDAEYIKKLHTGDGLLRSQNAAIGTGGDGLLHGRPKNISGTGEDLRGGN